MIEVVNRNLYLNILVPQVQGANPFLLNAERMLRNVETRDDCPHGVREEEGRRAGFIGVVGESERAHEVERVVPKAIIFQVVVLVPNKHPQRHQRTHNPQNIEYFHSLIILQSTQVSP